MRQKRLLLLAGVLGVMGFTAGCPGGGGTDQSVRDYLSDHGGPNALYRWEQLVGEAICQLEVNSPGTLDPTKQMCPGGPGGLIPPPKYPPP